MQRTCRGSIPRDLVRPTVLLCAHGLRMPGGKPQEAMVGYRAWPIMGQESRSACPPCGRQPEVDTCQKRGWANGPTTPLLRHDSVVLFHRHPSWCLSSHQVYRRMTDSEFRNALSQLVRAHLDDGADPKDVAEALELQRDVAYARLDNSRHPTSGPCTTTSTLTDPAIRDYEYDN